MTISLAIIFSCNQETKKVEVKGGFPWDIPQTRPDRPLSKAMERLYDNYLAPRPQDNELFSSFKYTELKGFDHYNHDGTFYRRDPSKIIKENGKYYVWYGIPKEIQKYFNYSASWWDWDRWQQEIDSMAMNGINMPLSVVGLEEVWYDT